MMRNKAREWTNVSKHSHLKTMYKLCSFNLSLYNYSSILVMLNCLSALIKLLTFYIPFFDIIVVSKINSFRKLRFTQYYFITVNILISIPNTSLHTLLTCLTTASKTSPLKGLNTIALYLTG